jgi:plastocyanin
MDNGTAADRLRGFQEKGFLAALPPLPRHHLTKEKEMIQKNHIRMLSLVVTMIIASACSGEKKTENESEEHAPAPAAPAPGPSAAATGDTIVVEAITDGTGNYFKPNKIEAHPGDVIRYKLTMGVHNVHFLPDSNTIKTGLPPASELLQLPGQTYDLVVTMEPGHYYFQCDPHAALGMKGTLEVEKD